MHTAGTPPRYHVIKSNVTSPHVTSNDTCQFNIIIMVAEPTLFLSSDDKLQVRAHTKKNGLKLYCIQDFVRTVANRDLLPSEALIYWMKSASSLELRTEHEIQDQYPVQFLGAYEPKSVCITAGGLLLLFLHMQRDGMVMEDYKEEMKQRLVVLSEGGGADYVRDHDDGEVDEMMAAKDAAISKGEGLTGPAENWPFFFDGVDGPSPEMAAQLQKVIESVSEMQVTVDTTATTTTAEEKVEEKKVRNLDKKTAFSLRGLMEEMDLMVERAFMPAIGKTVSAKFRQMCPDSETFSKKKITYFYLDDKVCLEKLVQEEHMKYMLRKVDDDFEQKP